jgi:hypothetical protein
MDDQGLSPELRRAGRDAAVRAVSGLGAISADPEKVAEMIQRTDCMARRDLYCLAGALGGYPGVRMLVLVESIETPDTLPGNARIRMGVVDTALLYRYPVMELLVPVDRSRRIETILPEAFHEAARFAVQKAKITPWLCRVFSGEKEEWFLSAGRRSGLKIGDTLTVLGGGRLVKSPTGLPAGWLPGERKGTVKLTQFFGSDFSVCQLVSGSAPGAGDLLIRH